MSGRRDGDLTIAAGHNLHVTGSVLHAGNDIDLSGKQVSIDAAYDTEVQTERQQFRQAGLTVGITSPAIAAVQTGQQMVSAVKQIGGDARLSALAAVTTGLAAKNLYDTISDGPAGAASVGINVSLGASHSDSQSEARAVTASGSTVSAGRDVHVTAVGAGQTSDIDIVGSTLSAGRNASLSAEGNVNLEAAQNRSSLYSSSHGASAGIGATFTLGEKNGIAFHLHAHRHLAPL